MLDKVFGKIKPPSLKVAGDHAASRISLSVLDHRGGYPWLTVKDILPDDVNQQIKSQNVMRLAGGRMLVDVFDNPHVIRSLYKVFGECDYPIRSDRIRSIYVQSQTTGPGHSLRPHEDAWPRVFTMIYYFPEDNSYPLAGTAIYEVDESTRTYKTVATSPYQINTATIMVPCTGHGWHGVDLITRPVNRQSAVIVFDAEPWDENNQDYHHTPYGRTVDYVR